jgi:hypothetical protein
LLESKDKTMERTRESLFKEWDGIGLAYRRLTARHEAGQLTQSTFEAKVAMITKQVMHVTTLLGVEGFKAYIESLQSRKERKLIRKLRQGLERQRVAMYGKTYCVEMAAHQFTLRKERES